VNFNEYEKEYFPIYRAFAETVRFILNTALLSAENIPSPQSIQYRAKSIESLRRRLADTGKLGTQTLQDDRRDLAGVRIIFYTNNDVDRFLYSSLVRDNFEIEEDSKKIHHPSPENKEMRYRAIHYTVRLCKNRIRLPEYARFAGLRCEIQVQTILNHAWSETSHDILYKEKLGKGYGRKAMKGIERRFDRIMDKYLIPAGFEIQKAQQEYESVLKGKTLFDRDITKLLDNAKNNNERYEILSGLRDYAIPNCDDLPAVYKGLIGSLLMSVKTARVMESLPIQTTYGNMEGFKYDAIAGIVLEIIDRLRYVDVVRTLKALIDIYREESNEKVLRQIENVVKNLSKYNIDVYEQVGPMLQMALLDHLAEMNDADLDAIWPIALVIWTEAIQSEITDAKWKANEAVLSRGAIPVSDQLSEVRNKAIKALFAAYDRSSCDVQKREILSALDAATRIPVQVQYSNELLKTTLKDAKRIVDFLTRHAKDESYELLQHLEHRFLHDYFLAKGFVDNQENRFDCQAESTALIASILKFRDTINADNRYVRYKVLVGFESVFPRHWTEEQFDYPLVDEYRREEANRYIDEINAESEDDWFNLIARCAETKSDDLATFPVFEYFISKFAECKPEVADRFLSKASDSMRKFLAGFLNGLAMSNRHDIYVRIMESELESAKNLAGIALHLRHSDVTQPDFANRLLKYSIDKNNTIAVIECLLFAIDRCGTAKISQTDIFLRDALTYLNGRKDSRWVSRAWFLQKAQKFYKELSSERTDQLLENLGYLSQVTYEVERILIRIAEWQPEKIWDYFGARLNRETEENREEDRFEAVPFQFDGLEKELSKDPQLAIRKGLFWFERDQKLFQFRGGRLLSIAFPKCTSELAAALASLVKNSDDTEANFALAILRNYEGETSTYSVLKEIIFKFPDDEEKMSMVRIAIDSTGVLSGELGFVDALRAKKESMKGWLTDERPAVKAFAEKHIAGLDLMIASELRRVEAEKEIRNRSYEEDDDDYDNETNQ